MALATGTRLGRYVIVAPLGAGGMGEVYRARDEELNRDVAIKVLLASVAGDPDRLARFRREAQVLASLNHPNIAHIHGLEDVPVEGGPALRGLVMELVEGDDLSALIARGPIPLTEALSIAKQIADALEAAHEQGIVHRDLKPANIKIRADGMVKILDFGLAKALSGEGTGVSLDAMASPTFTRQPTEIGMILGTAAYMAPEQARGKAVDRRADIWSFGVVLYEMLTGRRAFKGDDVSEVLACVLKTDPDWSVVSAEVPPSVRRLLRRCLEKDSRKRLSAIGDARLDLDEIEEQLPAPIAQPIRPRRSIGGLLWSGAAGMALAAVVAVVFWPGPRQSTAAGLTRLSIVPPSGAELYPDSAQVAISPDGRLVAFVVGETLQRASSQLWIRAVDSMTARRLEGGDGAHLPFWSPDSHNIGFGADGKLKRLPAAGGRSVVICDAPSFRGGSWNSNDVIVFAADAGGPIQRVSANGGEPAAVTTLDQARKESGHRFPVFLPDGDHFLFTAMPGRAGKFEIAAGSLQDGTRSPVASMESAPVYAAPGWLLFMRGAVLAAQPFDAATRKVTGEAVPLEDEPGAVLEAGQTFTAGRATSVSSSGALAYYSGSSFRSTAVWLDDGGKVSGSLALPAGRYTALSISPDGGRAVLIRSTSRTESSLWLADLQRGGATPFSTGAGRNESPVWSPDSTRVVFASDRDGTRDLYVKDVADAGPERLLYRSGLMFKTPTAWSPDGKWIVFNQLEAGTDYNIYLLPASGDAAPTLYLRGPTADMGGSISPDGKGLTYLSEDSGTLEIYVQSFPAPGHKARIATAGGPASWWSRGGRQISYLAGNRRSLMIADVEPATLQVGTPRVGATLPAGLIAVDAMPDRLRWLALVPETAGAGTVTVVQNWMAALKK